MTNIKSIGGSMVWMAVAAVLMLATFEPVSPAPDRVEAKIGQLAATPPAAPAAA